MNHISYKGPEIAEIINARLISKDPESINVVDILIDSRRLISAKSTLFFALVSKKNDGHNYIEELYKKGIRYFVVSSYTNDYDKLVDSSFFIVDDTHAALQLLASNHRRRFNIPVVGITGSNGKTVIKEWLYQLLNPDKRIVRSPKSYNSQIGVPLSVWAMTEKNNLGIFEAGISEPDEMQNLQNVIQPTIGIFSNIGSAHGQNFISDIHKVKEKLKLFLRSKVLIYCKDHSAVNQSVSDFWQHTINDDTEKPEFFSWSENVFADLKINSEFIPAEVASSPFFKVKFLSV